MTYEVGEDPVSLPTPEISDLALIVCAGHAKDIYMYYFVIHSATKTVSKGFF